MSTAGSAAKFADLRKFDIEKQLKSNIVLIFALVEDIVDGKRAGTPMAGLDSTDSTEIYNIQK
jgi:hypothetical protein